VSLAQIRAVRVPRNIFLYWHDGWEKAPDVAKLCLRSWIEKNPDWKVHALDYAALPSNIDRPPVHKASSNLAGFSDRVRLALLRKKGGVWADATLFCSQPLGAWIDPIVSAPGFFAFSAPAADRVISTWFLIARQNSELIQAWDEIVIRYFGFLEQKKTKIQAYFFAHHLLEYAVETHPRLLQLWNFMPKISANASRAGLITRLAQLTTDDEKLMNEELDDKQIERIRAILNEGIVHKLTWKAAVKQKSRRSLQVMESLENYLSSANLNHSSHHV
jgi:hypothetical protein